MLRIEKIYNSQTIRLWQYEVAIITRGNACNVSQKSIVIKKIEKNRRRSKKNGMSSLIQLVLCFQKILHIEG